MTRRHEGLSARDDGRGWTGEEGAEGALCESNKVVKKALSPEEAKGGRRAPMAWTIGEDDIARSEAEAQAEAEMEADENANPRMSAQRGVAFVV